MSVTSTLLPILRHMVPVPEGHSCDSIPGGTWYKERAWLGTCHSGVNVTTAVWPGASDHDPLTSGMFTLVWNTFLEHYRE